MGYGILLYQYTDNIDRPTMTLIMFSMPVFSYISIVVTDAGMVNFHNDLRPYLMRLLPTTKKRLAVLPLTRKNLQNDLKAFIQKMSPVLGDIYSAKELDWKAIQEMARKQETVVPVVSSQSKKDS